MLVCIGLEIQLDLIIDLVQMLCWVGIVFSDTENSNSLRLARSKLKFAYLDDCTFDMDFMVYSFPMDEALSSVCWTSLLRGSHIAQNFCGTFLAEEGGAQEQRKCSCKVT